ncbi:MAG: hypothetical protein HRT86_04715 [Ilumatobacteraceae bacterium]|nr:hypothetical protein [Ilumatobacteraceae bacterium]
MTPTPGPELVVAVMLLLALALVVARVGRLPVGTSLMTAAACAALQLAVGGQRGLVRATPTAAAM